MKKILYLVFCGLLSFSFATSTLYAQSKKLKKEETQGKVKAIEGGKVRAKYASASGVVIKQELDETGDKLVKVPYKWWSGDYEADNEGAAKRAARKNAFEAVSENILNIVQEKAEDGTIIVQGNTLEATRMYWQQISMSIIKGCGAYEDYYVQYIPGKKGEKGMYKVTAKVGMRGSDFKKLVNDAGKFNENELNVNNVQNFIQLNDYIIKSAQGEYEAQREEAEREYNRTNGR